MGVAIMNTRTGQHIVSQFGGHGLRANIGKNVFEIRLFGYPAESPFDGGNLMRCSGPRRRSGASCSGAPTRSRSRAT